MPKSLWIRHVHYSLMRVGRFWLCEDLVAPCKEFGVEVATCSLSTFKRKPGNPFIPHLLYASKILPFHKVSDSRNEMRSFRKREVLRGNPRRKSRDRDKFLGKSSMTQAQKQPALNRIN